MQTGVMRLNWGEQSLKKSLNSETYWNGRFASKQDDDVLFDCFTYNWTKHHEKYQKG